MVLLYADCIGVSWRAHRSDRLSACIPTKALLTSLLIAVCCALEIFEYRTLPRDPRSVVPERFFHPLAVKNHHDFTYLFEPQDVGAITLDLLLIIRSAPDHFERRSAIRHTWGNASFYTQMEIGLKTVFVIGRSADSLVHRRIKEEAASHRDVLFVDFLDTYANLTIKDIVAFKYAVTRFAFANYVAIAGDEIVVYIPDVMKNIIENQEGAVVRQVSFCYDFPCCMPVHRDTLSRYVVHNGVYEADSFPAYCSGTFFILPAHVLKEVYYAALDTPYFMPDDAWLGIIYEKLGVSIQGAHSHYMGISSYRKELRILKYFENCEFLQKGIYVAVLDYAYADSEITSMLLRVWSALLSCKSHQLQLAALHYNRYQHGNLTFWDPIVLCGVVCSLTVLFFAAMLRTSVLGKRMIWFKLFTSILFKYCPLFLPTTLCPKFANSQQ